MVNRNQNAATAGVLYLLSGTFAVGVLLIWVLTPPRASLNELLSPPGAALLFSAIVFLFLSSVALGGFLLSRRNVTPTMLGIGGLLACIGFWWSVLAGLFWLTPILFVWRAMRKVPKHDD
jgi:hypothetical protein